MPLIFNNIHIDSRDSDNYINATQMCQVGGKLLGSWYRLESTRLLISTLETKLNNRSSHNIRYNILSRDEFTEETLTEDDNIISDEYQKAVEIKPGRNGGAWIHPDLAVQLAQWICPIFSLQVSEWVRELMCTGTVSIDNPRSRDEVDALQRQLNECKQTLEEERIRWEEDRKNLSESKCAIAHMQRFIEDQQPIQMNQVFYIATTTRYASTNTFKYGGVGTASALASRLSSYNVGRSEDDLMYYTKIIHCAKYSDIEHRVGTVLSQFKDKQGGVKEMVHIRYDALEQVIDYICEHYDAEITHINQYCKTFLMDAVYKPALIPPAVDLKDHLTVSVVKHGGKSRTCKIDITGWTDDQIDTKIEEFVNLCARTKIPDYKFDVHGKDVPVEIHWKELKEYMKQYNQGMLVWRGSFKKWICGRDTKLVVKGVDTRSKTRALIKSN